MEQSKQTPIRCYAGQVIVLVALLFGGCTHYQPLPDWLIGSWHSTFDGIDIRETWQQDEDKLVGTTVWSWDNKQRREIITLHYNDENKLIYRQITEHKKNLEYVCENPLADTLVFVNNKVDFPRRLNYVKSSIKKMNVWIDNEQNDPNRVSFPFTKD